MKRIKQEQHIEIEEKSQQLKFRMQTEIQIVFRLFGDPKIADRAATASSCRTIFMTSALKEELKKWLNRLAADEMKDPTRYHDSGMPVHTSLNDRKENYYG